jgi:hypothetical protein
MMAVALLLGAGFAANGLYMLADPAGWYAAIPNVSATGPFNPHFVRDIGCAYLVTGLAMAGRAIDERLRAAMAVGAVFLTLHALVHIADIVAGRAMIDHALPDLLTVIVPAALALLLALIPPPTFRSTPMLNWLIRRRLAAFERTYDYDASYVREILAIDRSALTRFYKAAGLSNYRKDLPRDAGYAAGITAVLAEDCGPCTQLCLTMAERDGVPADVLKAVVIGDERRMPDDVALAVRYTKAVLAHDPAADDLRARIVDRWGKRALVTLAFAITAARIYPTVKYALGYGQACRRLVVGGTPVPVVREAA